MDPLAWILSKLEHSDAFAKRFTSPPLDIDQDRVPYLLLMDYLEQWPCHYEWYIEHPINTYLVCRWTMRGNRHVRIWEPVVIEDRATINIS
jgi:hypothetical protein